MTPDDRPTLPCPPGRPCGFFVGYAGCDALAVHGEMRCERHREREQECREETGA